MKTSFDRFELKDEGSLGSVEENLVVGEIHYLHALLAARFDEILELLEGVDLSEVVPRVEQDEFQGLLIKNKLVECHSGGIQLFLFCWLHVVDQDTANCFLKAFFQFLLVRFAIATNRFLKALLY
jgi:hypothetical protein